MSERAAIVVERVLPAEPGEVFAVFGDARSLAAIMVPGEVARAEVELDFRVGGAFRIVMHGEREYVQHGTFLEIDPPKRLLFSWVSEFIPELEADTRVCLTFEPAGPGETRLRLVHDRLPAGDSYNGHEQGWNDIVTHLARWLAEQTSSTEEL